VFDGGSEVPADHRVYLHIGAPKTGTTYLQAVCARNREQLRLAGVLYPDAFGDAHHKAVWDLRETPGQREAVKGIEGSWDRLVDVANATTSDVLISSEHLVFALPEHLSRALSSLDGEVHVIYTARDLVRQVPAVWQERVKNQKTMTYRTFVRSVMEESGPGAKSFWEGQDAPRVLRPWSDRVGADRVHIVTAPPSGSPPTLLWDRFVSVLGLTGSDFDATATEAANESLSILQAELLRRYNERHGNGLPWPAYRLVIRRQIGVLAGVDDGRKIVLRPDEYAFLSARAREICDAVTDAGYDVVGELADLIPAPQSPVTGAEDPTELSDAELLDAALDVVHQMLTAQAETRRAARRADRRGEGGGG
jgi:hypothetical protein